MQSFGMLKRVVHTVTTVFKGLIKAEINEIVAGGTCASLLPKLSTAQASTDMGQLNKLLDY
jgi:hypothetical protein